MPNRFLFVAMMAAGLAILSGCNGTLAPDPASVPDPPGCAGSTQLGNTPCPSIVDPYARNVTTGKIS